MLPRNQCLVRESGKQNQLCSKIPDSGKALRSNSKGSQKHTVGLICTLNVSALLRYLCFLLPEMIWSNYHFVLCQNFAYSFHGLQKCCPLNSIGRGLVTTGTAQEILCREMTNWLHFFQKAFIGTIMVLCSEKTSLLGLPKVLVVLF